MKYDPQKHHRRSIRLQGYNYSQPGAYFVTICTNNRRCLFGNVVDGTLKLNDAGKMIERWWNELNNKFPDIKTDEYIIMPNHFHGIIINVGSTPNCTNVECANTVGTNPMGQNPMGTGTNPAGTNMVGTNPMGQNPVGTGTNPAGANMVGTNPMGQNAVGTGTNPAGANMVGTNPMGQNPVGTKMGGTNPMGQNPVGTGTNPAGANMVGTNPMGQNPVRTNPVGANLVGANLRVCPYQVSIQTGEHIQQQMGEHIQQQMGEHIGSPLHGVVQWFKTMTTNDYIKNVKINKWEPFDKKLWQRNYYEHIIRNDDELHRIRQYIINNPLNWKNDENHI